MNLSNGKNKHLPASILDVVRTSTGGDGLKPILYVWIVVAYSCMRSRIVGVYDSERTARIRIGELREMHGIHEDEFTEVIPEEVWSDEE